jgi:hypothetical protein
MRLHDVKLHEIKQDLMVHARSAECAAGAASGIHIGRVDQLEPNGYIKLKSKDSLDGRCHWIPVEWVDDVDDKAVYLRLTTDEVLRSLALH